MKIVVPDAEDNASCVLVNEVSKLFSKMEQTNTTTLCRSLEPKKFALNKNQDLKNFRHASFINSFYPVTNGGYSLQIARNRSVKAPGSGFVTQLEVDLRILKIRFKTLAAGYTTNIEYRQKNGENSIIR